MFIIVFCSLLIGTLQNNGTLVAQVWFLNNGGQILSDHEDWITWEISAHDSQDILVCGQYKVQPGDQIKYDNLVMPIEDGKVLTITLKQRNTSGKDDSISIITQMNRQNMGFYLAKLSLDQFRLGITIGFSFEGVQIDVDPYKYVVSADYYLLVELREKTLCDNYYIEYPNEQEQCHLWDYNITFLLGSIIMFAFLA